MSISPRLGSAWLRITRGELRLWRRGSGFAFDIQLRVRAGGFAFDEFFQPAFQSGFDLAYTFAADPVFVAYFLERLRLLGKKARAEYLQLLIFKRFLEGMDLLARKRSPFGVS